MSTIRDVTRADAEQLLKIYAPIVQNTAISFETEVPSILEFAERISKITSKYPWVCLEISGVPVAYAYASEHRARAAYQWSVDITAYVSEEHRGRGFGKMLYTSLFERLKKQEFYNVFAGIALPNPASVALHQSMGMKCLGVYQSVGFKLGKWHDVGWWQGKLKDYELDPKAPVVVF